jgi:hypothetical protein
LPDAFSSDYATARGRFRQAALHLGWQLEAHALDARGPRGEELTIDVACSSAGDPRRVLVVSSGVHGVEGFFGSAVQLALLELWAATSPPAIKCVLLHGLNPYGFAWLRRVDENNVDPNRNFLLPGERFEGAHEHYSQLDQFLNLRRPPARWDMFTLRALPLIARYGVPALRQAIAEGQYSHPRGLFYGGAGPSQMQQLLRQHLPRWLAGSRSVVHLDFHTGLGRRRSCKLIVDYSLSERQRDHLTDWFGAGSFQAANASGSSYEARGGLGRWCVSRHLAPEYLFAVAEFGTYSSIRVLAGLRAENQAHHWGDRSAPMTLRAKERLKELFCPADSGWRSRMLEHSVRLVHRALTGLQG